MKEIIRKLTECYGPSGHEAGVRQLILAELTDGGVLSGRKIETRVDAMGNLLVHQKGNGGGRKVMLAAHMDEIGVVVTHVDQRGFLRFGSVGGVRPLSLSGGRVRFSDGTVGVIGLEKLEDAAKIPPLEKYFIDVGAASRAECLIKVGDIGCFQRTCEELGDRMIAKAMDDRIGCAVLIQVMRELRDVPARHLLCLHRAGGGRPARRGHLRIRRGARSGPCRWTSRSRGTPPSAPPWRWSWARAPPSRSRTEGCSPTSA